MKTIGLFITAGMKFWK